MSDSPNIITQLDITDPQQLYTFTQLLQEPTSFILDRYFPTNPETDIFATESVLIDYNKTSSKLAPFMWVGSKDTERDGFYTDEFTPFRIAPSRPLTMDDIKVRQFGESLFSGRTPEERAVAFAAMDLTDLMHQHIRRKEKMAADCLIGNGYTCKYEDEKSSLPKEKTIRFYETNNDCLYVPSVPWDGSNADIISDLQNMGQLMSRRGIAAVDLLIGDDVASIFRKDKEIRALLDNRRMDYGELAPKMREDGAVLMGVLNTDGIMLNLITYSKEYEDENGENKKYLDPSKVVMTAPGVGKCLYGAVTQLEQGAKLQSTYKGKYVPKYVGDHENDTRHLRLVGCPLLVPRKKNCWISADVLTPAAPGA